MPLSLQEPADGGFDYKEVIAGNFAAIQAFVNALAQQVVAAGGTGSQLLLDIFDRPGIVGVGSYHLDWENYAGGGQITIGRRPAPVGDEQDVSAAFGIFGGTPQRVQQTGDVVLDAVPITGGLPKTIYVGVGSSGTAQLFEDTLNSNVLYIYSLCWNGISLTEPRRLGHYLPGYTLFQALLKHAQVVQVQDWETQWTGDVLAEVSLPLHGGPAANGIGVNQAVELIGGFIDIPKSGAGRFFAPSTIKNLLKLKLMSNGIKVNQGEIEINVASTPDRIYFAIDAEAMGDERYVTEVADFRLERVSIGEHVVSARGYTLGLFFRPILGVPIPKDAAFVDQV